MFVNPNVALGSTSILLRNDFNFFSIYDLNKISPYLRKKLFYGFFLFCFLWVLQFMIFVDLTRFAIFID